MGDLFTTLRLSVEILNAVVDCQEAEITRLLTRDVEREKEMIVLRERNSKWETQLRAQGGVPTLVIVVKLLLLLFLKGHSQFCTRFVQG